MRSIFFRLYMGILLAILAVLLLLSVSTYYISKHRLSQHLNQNYSGTFQLIGEGVSRHQGEKRQQWLAAIEKLSDLKFTLLPLTTPQLSVSQRQRLRQQEFIFQIDTDLISSRVLIPLPDTEHYLSVELNDLGSSLVRVSAFLMLNELGRHKSSQQRSDAFDKLRQIFNYPILLKAITELDLPMTSLRSVKKGDIAVVLKSAAIQTPFIKAYAPFGNTKYALVLGPIPLFDWWPLPMVLGLLFSILLIMAALSFLLVRPLERRLAHVDQQVERIGLDKELSMAPATGADAIGKLANTVNSMAARIHKLIDAQNDMVRAISHELRTPITRIRFRLTTLEQQVTETQTQTQDTSISGIERDLEELESLIDEVLTFSKLNQNQPELELECFPLTELVEHLLTTAKLTRPEIQVQLINIDQQYIQADRRYLQRAIENLLTNALRYAKQAICISYQQTDQQQQIAIADDGPGIPVSERESLFQPFKRIDQSRNRQSGGYGLGLAIVAQIARWHQGEVKIGDSELAGAKISFNWPTKDGDKSQTSTKKRPGG